jgi:hypothetical protein
MLSRNGVYDASPPAIFHLQPSINSNFHFLILVERAKILKRASVCLAIMLINNHTSLE